MKQYFVMGFVLVFCFVVLPAFFGQGMETNAFERMGQDVKFVNNHNEQPQLSQNENENSQNEKEKDKQNVGFVLDANLDGRDKQQSSVADENATSDQTSSCCNSFIEESQNSHSQRDVDDAGFPKYGYDLGMDNFEFDVVNFLHKDSNKKREKPTILPIEDKMIKDHKKEHTEKEVPGTNELTHNANTKQEQGVVQGEINQKQDNEIKEELQLESPEKVTLLHVFESATVVMQDNIHYA